MLVVFGHVIEPMKSGVAQYLYWLIYSFHMPLFCFVSGRFASFKPSRILKNLLFPYLVYQVLYIVLFRRDNISVLDPFWIMWYLWALILWTLTVPFLDMANKGRKIAVVLAASAISIVSGFDSHLGYSFQMARVFAFYPFFVLGHYFKGSAEKIIFGANRIIKVFSAFAAGGAVVILTVVFALTDINRNLLYNNQPYIQAGYSWAERTGIFLIAAVISYFILCIMPDKKCVLSYIGQKSIYIYLVHGFAMKLIYKYYDLVCTGIVPALILTAVTAAVILLLSPVLKYTAGFSFKFKKREDKNNAD